MPLTQKQVQVVRVGDGHRRAALDHAAAEEPLEVRLHGRPFAVIMRTPGADRELAAGFLLAERVVANADDVGTIEHCRDVRPAPDGGDVHPENIVNVTLSGQAIEALDEILAGRRRVVTNSSCGLCGRLTIESLKTDMAPLVCTRQVTAEVIAALPDRLRKRQAVFDDTGGLHAAALFTADGAIEAIAEDVGRHNAVDKVIGRMLIAEALPLSNHILFVSGRTSFEIVQKAALAGVPIVGSVSAPSSLAVDLAHEAGMTLLGFVRDGHFNIYSHPERVA